MKLPLPYPRNNEKDDVKYSKKNKSHRKRSSSVPIRLDTKLISDDSYILVQPGDTLNGFYVVFISNQILYEGLFKNNQRFGPGVLTFFSSMCQNIGWWNSHHILRLSQIIHPLRVPTLITIPKLAQSNNKQNANKKANNVGEMYSRLELNELEIFFTDVEAMLNMEHLRVLVKPCITKKHAIHGFETLLPIANTQTMMELLNYTSEHLNKETTFNLTNLIKNQRDDFGAPAVYERACMDFLNCCANGNLTYINRLILNYRVSPDICDGRGNVGVMYAAARDKIEIIVALAKHQAHFDLFNDEGLTPLSVVLLRFIALLRNVQNWSLAFLHKDNSPSAAPFVRQAPPNEDSLLFSDIAFYYHDKPLQSLQDRISMSVQETFAHYALHLPSPGLQNFENLFKPYTNTTHSNEALIFDFRLKNQVKFDNRSSVPCKAKHSRKIESQTFMHLTVVFNTFVLLLHYGSDPCKSNYPLPAIFMGLFTESPDVIRMLLKYGADPYERLNKFHNLNVLHALVSMHLGDYLISVAKLLLARDFDMNARTDGDHWQEEQRWVIGKKKAVLDKGKTALHILAMRRDFHTDPKCVKHLAALIIMKGGSCSEQYMGHVPLTLAMLRGNRYLVKSFLKNGTSANSSLGVKMGTPLTVYLLKRYTKRLPSFDACESIMHLLFLYGGDPLAKIDHTMNAFDFISADWQPTRRLTSKKNSFHFEVKPLSFTGLQSKIKLMLVNYARSRLIRHYECLMFITILPVVRNGVSVPNDIGFYLELSRFMNFDHALKIARYLMFMDVIDPHNNADMKVLYDFFEFLYMNSRRTKTKETVAVSDVIRNLKPLNPNGYRPEFDTDFNKYRVCFMCLSQTGKLLLSCPCCGLVHFCSARCEKLCKKYKLHPCKVTFYKDELAQYNFSKLHEIHYEGVHDEVFNNVRKILVDLINRLKSV